jgi:DNA-binding transcriptional MerR regulator
MNELDLITGAEAARLLGVDPATVSRWSSEDLVPEARKLTAVTRVGRYKMFKRRDIEALRSKLQEGKAS